MALGHRRNSPPDHLHRFTRAAESIPRRCRPTGRTIIYTVAGTDSDGSRYWTLPRVRPGCWSPRARSPRLSPDGRWLAYRKSESGITDVYVSPYPNVASARWQVSTGGGASPRWSHDSTELFYRGLGSNRSHMFVCESGRRCDASGRQAAASRRCARLGHQWIGRIRRRAGRTIPRPQGPAQKPPIPQCDRQLVRGTEAGGARRQPHIEGFRMRLALRTPSILAQRSLSISRGER